MRALAKANVFPHLVQALGQTHFGHLEEAKIANEQPATFTSSKVTNEKIADFIASLLSNQAMTSKMLSEGKDSTTEADGKKDDDDDDDDGGGEKEQKEDEKR